MKRIFAGLLMLALLFSVPALSEEVPYLVSLIDGTGIYKGPGDAYSCVSVLGSKGTYTIVEEAVCEDGYLWGKLKSGAGWVRLSDQPVVGSDFQEVCFTVSLPAWVNMYSKHGYDGEYRGCIGKDGVYTIVETGIDEAGSLWGRLKSGAGWVNLTDYESQMMRPVTVALADQALLDSGKYIFCQAEPSEYSVKIAIRAKYYARNVKVSSTTLSDEDWRPEQLLCQYDLLTSDLPLVVEVTFWGDMTSFLLDFVDEYGTNRLYMICTSGMDGTIQAYEYVN